MRPDYLVYALLFVLIGLMFTSFLLVWHWYNARERMAIVREGTRDETIKAIRESHTKCRWLLGSSIAFAVLYVILPILLHDFYSTLIYSALVVVVDTVMLIMLRVQVNDYINRIDEFIEENEEHVREAAEARERERESWRRDAKDLNRAAREKIRKVLSDKYETWFEHDILLSRCVLANRELGLLFAQGIFIPFSQIMEVRKGRKDLKLVTSNSMHPFITIDFETLPVDPETGRMYQDEIAENLKEIMP